MTPRAESRTGMWVRRSFSRELSGSVWMVQGYWGSPERAHEQRTMCVWVAGDGGGTDGPGRNRAGSRRPIGRVGPRVGMMGHVGGAVWVGGCACGTCRQGGCAVREVGMAGLTLRRRGVAGRAGGTGTWDDGVFGGIVVSGREGRSPRAGRADEPAGRYAGREGWPGWVVLAGRGGRGVLGWLACWLYGIVMDTNSAEHLNMGNRLADCVAERIA